MRLDSLRGYLLEEALAFLLRASGYELLTRAEDDPVELVAKANGLNVRGRGADHQADVLGQLAWTPAFSRPLRLFVEAKYRRNPIGVEEMRQAVGILQDLNSRYSRRDSGGPLVRRYSYRYAIFSTSGFSRPAADYALAHELSIVDLRVGAFHPMVEAIRLLASDVNSAMPDGRRPGIVSSVALRATLRTLLGTNTVELEPDWPERWDSPSTQEGLAVQTLLRIPEQSRGNLAEDDILPLVQACTPLAHWIAHEQPIVVGAPEAPFFLAMRPDSWTDFVAYVRQHGDHGVHAEAHIQGDRVLVSLRPQEGPGAYALRFSLPYEVEQYILGGDNTSRRLRELKRAALAHVTASVRDRGQDRLVRLYYVPRPETSW
ncbi:restriction endonuclease [Cellulomonas biazotea]|uniref:Uncharacterized protein n=1 Tax=Cellulomonas biazotea TaxID=1709 RepID=A0A402DNH2_9CELL|nr:restriction endonuclease [Cellulomonas biazotea]GCE75669.1 hypothetical protein CBZ_07250 [Cellulomonas biazotea]